MTRMLLIAAGILVGILVTSGAQSNRPGRTLTLKDDGKTVGLKKGSVLTLRLETRSGTGFSWRIVKNDSKILKYLGDKVETPPNIEGHAETHIFRFRANSVGRTLLELHYRRPWEKNRPDERKFSVNIVVQ